LKVVSWLAPLVRARDRLTSAAAAALQLQMGGAVGTLAGLDDKGAAVAARVGAHLGLPVPAGAWHVQRDCWVALGCEVALLCGSLGKIGTDLALLAQGEVGELSEPNAPGRGISSALPHKRNPVAALAAIAAAGQAPQRAAALLAAMPQEHERSLGHWQAELAQWPGLFLSAHGSLRALADACAGLEIHPAAMRANIDAHLRAVGARSKAAAVDVDGEARRAGALAMSQLDVLQRHQEGTRP
jgi:3-carboxy-cis,cis-muconate cycloisomerase